MNDTPDRPSSGSETSGTSPHGTQGTPPVPEQPAPPAAEEAHGRPRDADSAERVELAKGAEVDPPRQPGPDAGTGGVPTPPPPHWAPVQPPPGAWGPVLPPPGPGGQVPPMPPVPPAPSGPGYGSPGYGQPGYGPAGYGQQPYSPAGWSMPGAPGPYPYYAPPPPPQPGVIPLRPLGVGDMFEGALATVRANWRTMLGVSLLIAVLTVIAQTLATHFLVGGHLNLSFLTDDSADGPRELMNFYRQIAPGIATTTVISLLSQSLASSLLILIVSRAVLGRGIALGEVWREARPQVWRMILLPILMALSGALLMGICLLPAILTALAGSMSAAGGLLGLGVLVGGVLLVWLMVSWWLAPPALMLERQGPLTALARSTKLVRGSWWRTLGILLLTLLLVGIVGQIIEVPFTAFIVRGATDGSPGMLAALDADLSWQALILSGIGQIIASTVMLPFSAAMVSLLYIDTRIRREGLDIELARAAGIPSYGPR